MFVMNEWCHEYAFGRRRSERINKKKRKERDGRERKKDSLCNDFFHNSLLCAIWWREYGMYFEVYCLHSPSLFVDIAGMVMIATEKRGAIRRGETFLFIPFLCTLSSHVHRYILCSIFSLVFSCSIFCLHFLFCCVLCLWYTRRHYMHAQWTESLSRLLRTIIS